MALELWLQQFPDQGLNLNLLHWECGVLATGPSGKSSLDFSEQENDMPKLLPLGDYFSKENFLRIIWCMGEREGTTLEA